MRAKSALDVKVISPGRHVPQFAALLAVSASQTGSVGGQPLGLDVLPSRGEMAGQTAARAERDLDHQPAAFASRWT